MRDGYRGARQIPSPGSNSIMATVGVAHVVKYSWSPVSPLRTATVPPPFSADGGLMPGGRACFGLGSTGLISSVHEPTLPALARYVLSRRRIGHIIAGTQHRHFAMASDELQLHCWDVDRHGEAPLSISPGRTRGSIGRSFSERTGHDAAVLAYGGLHRPPSAPTPATFATVSTHAVSSFSDARPLLCLVTLGFRRLMCERCVLTRSCALPGCGPAMASLRTRSAAILLLATCCMLHVAAAAGAGLPAWTKSASGALPCSRTGHLPPLT